MLTASPNTSFARTTPTPTRAGGGPEVFQSLGAVPEYPVAKKGRSPKSRPHCQVFRAGNHVQAFAGTLQSLFSNSLHVAAVPSLRSRLQ